ncbi:helix-turn-helix transcriptional regulator [Salibaculum griseiflavum]|uniref:Helix-turn-helix transcriptional regulator n=1 Tax=Salibaculum griseiflavum TaxID=1914409 RepID=A0A2V1P6Q4_9RHOB|nr:helix-turn-helix transcriptional regulator [Salibaculum griseiflavum]PWG17494.1 helix-turn-helix transcriptional regulator [Salibaculum griseiflavum]
MQGTSKKPAALMALIAAQVLCAGFFLWDVGADGVALGLTALSDWHFAIELVAALALISAVVIETRYLLTLLRRSAHLEHQVSIAASAFHDVIEEHFQGWGLTPAERDIAHFMVKGFSISEIAELRGSAEGTVKSHLNAIYRKAEVTNRGELLSLLIEDLMAMPVATETGADNPPAPASRPGVSPVS